MTSHWNMTFSLFLLDARPFSDLRADLEDKLGCRFIEDLKSRADGKLRYTSLVLGLNISCVFGEQWTEGAIYRFVGNNAAGYRFDTLEKTDISFHMEPVLAHVGCLRVMKLEEFRVESQRRGLR